MGKKVAKIDKNTNEITVYNSISEAARVLNIKHTRIVKYFTNNKQKPYKGRYTFKKKNIGKCVEYLRHKGLPANQQAPILCIFTKTGN